MEGGGFVKCPHCEGRGPFLAFVHRSDGSCTQEMMECSFCKGVGEVAEIRAHAWAKGRELREIRIKADRSMFDVAKLLGLTSPQYSDIENGRRHANYEQLARRIQDWL